MLHEIYTRSWQIKSAQDITEILQQQKGLNKLLSITAEQLREEPVVLNLILDEIRELGKRNGLQVYEVPHIIILETEAWTADNGLLTPSFKPNRKVLSRKYGPSLVALYEKALRAPQTSMMNTLQASSESDISSEDTSDPILISAKRTLESELGLSGAKVLDTPLQAIGIDSITAIKLAKSFSHILNIAVSPQAFLDQISDTTLRELFTNSSSHSHQIHYDMKLEYKLPPEIEKDLAICSSQPMPHSGSIFLTGATGFIGVHLVYKLLQLASPTSKIYCLVRTSQNAPESPTNKLKLALSRYSVNIPESVFEERIVCLNGDLGSHKFGISFADWRNLVEKVTCIIHNAAVTSSLQPYGSLRIPNVNGTMEAIRLACDFGTPKRFVYVSSLSVFCRSELAKPTPILELKCGVDDSNQEVQEQVEEVERIRRQLGEAEKKLVSARQKHETLVDKEKKIFEQQKISTMKTEELRKIRRLLQRRT